MAFDPDAYLRGISSKEFDPDKYLSGLGLAEPATREVPTFLGVSAKEFAEAAVPESDILKRIVSSGIQGVAGAPAGAEAALRAPVRQVMGEGLLEQSELYQLGRRLFGREPTQEEIAETQARKIETDRTINDSIPLIPGLQELAQGGRDVADFIRERQSPEALEAVRGSQMQGNLLEAITSGDYSKLSFGENPTLYGYALQGADVLGSLIPVIVSGAMGPVAAGAVGGSMAAGEAAQNAKDFVKSKSDVELAAASPYYKDLIAAGVPPEQARSIIADRAAEQAAFLQGSVATIGGVATQKLIAGAADNIINAAGRNRLMKIAVGGTLAGAEEGTQEFLEGIAADLGINKEVIKEIGEDSFANFVLGFIGGAPAGMARGALPDQQQPAQPGAPTTTPPAAAPAAAAQPPAAAAPTAAAPTTPPAGPSPVTPVTPSAGILGGYTNPADQTETQIIPAPNGQFQVLMIDTATGQTQDGGTFGTFDEANNIAAQIAGVAPTVTNVTVPPAVTPPVTPTGVSVTPPTSPTPPTPPAGTVTPPTPPAGTVTPPKPPVIKPAGRPAKEIQTDINKARQELKRAETAFKKNKVGQEAVDVAAAKLSTFEAEKLALTTPPELPPEVTAPEVEAVPELPAKGPKTVFEEKMFGKEPILSEEELTARKDISDKQRALNIQYNRIKGTKGFNNLADLLSGRAAQPAKIEGADRPLPDGMLAIDEDLRRIDFGVGRGATLRRNSFVSKTGRGKPLQQMIEDGQLNDFLPDNLQVFVRAEDVYDPNEFSKVRNAVDHIIERIENDDFLTEYDKMALRVIDEDIQKLSKELTLGQINARLAEIAAEERAGEAEGVTPAISEADLGRVETTQIREPSPEERRRAELERDFFSLTAPTPPERTTPPGAQKDLFGVEGLEQVTPEKVTKRKKENAEQLSLFANSQLPPNEDNQAGKTARREAVSTVDALQSTDNPLALALSTDYARRQRVSLVGQKVTGHDDLAVLSQVYRHPRFETFRMFFVNDKNEIVSQLGVTSRLPAAAIVIVGDDSIKYMEQVQEAAVKAGATGVWMLHNHPSGNVEVSKADQSMTKSFTNAFTKLAYKGHIVIDTNKYSVIAPEGYVQTYSKDMGQKELLQKNPLTASEAFHPFEIAKRVDENPESMVVIALGNDFSVTGITTIDNDAFKNKTPEQVTRTLFRLAISQSGGRLLVASRDRDALKKVGPSVEDGIWIKPNGQYERFSQMFSRRTKFLFPDDRPGVVTPDTSKLFDFLRVPKVPSPGGYQYFRWSDMRKLMEEQVTIKVQEPQADLFGEDAKTIKDLDENLPKAKKKLPPGRSPELAALAELLQEGKVTKEEYDQAVNRFRPIAVYTEPLTPATDEQVVNALTSDQKPKANISIPDGTKVGLRLDIPAWNRHKTFVVSIHGPRKSMTSGEAGVAIGYRSAAMAKNVTFGLGNQLKSLDIAAGAKKNSLQTMEGEYINASPGAVFELAKQAINDPRYVQIGFDPTRHAYFYDRRTTLPVVKADEVIQIGNMILARGVEYGSKENFLYNIDMFQSSLFGGKESDALEKADEPVPAKAVQRGRSPELTEAADKLRRGEITKKEYEALVDKYSPVKLYAEVPKPATDKEVVDALASNKRQYANQPIAQGKRVGLRLDIPALQQHGVGVVSIHEPKPSVKSPKALAILSYRSVAGLKNVVFAVGDQLKALDTAAGAFKDKLQTMEGDYIDLSPEQAFAKAKEVFNNPDYVQIGLNPTRHAYFYDRLTMQPVVSADEVIQIGQFVMAKNPKYASKDDFLYDINKYPQVTQDHADQFPANTREEMIAEYASLRARRTKLVKEFISGGATIDLQRRLTVLDELSKQLKEDIDATMQPSVSPENFLRRALEAYDKGDLSSDVLATIQDAYNKTPWVLNGLRLSIKTVKAPGRATGNFNPFERIVTLWNGTAGVENPSTVRHEIMHSLEQMMTPQQRKVVIDSWQDSMKKAIQKNKDPESQAFFQNVLEFIDKPSEASYAAAAQSLPSYDFYQYLGPSEYWAVNAEPMMAAKLGSAWDRFVKAIKKYVEALKNVFGVNNRYAVHKIFDRIMSDQPTRMSRDSLVDFVAETGARPMTLENIKTNVFGQPLTKAQWQTPSESKMDNFIYKIADKHIDTKRVVEEIKAAGKQIADRWNPYLAEELYHNRTSKQTKDFLLDELAPLVKEIESKGLNLQQVEEYLHNRHAETRNKFNAKRDPTMPDGGSGIMTKDAQAYLASLTPQQRSDFDSIAKRIDKIIAGTQDLIVSTGQETQDVIDAWRKALPDYVPLNREESDYDVKNVGNGVGSGIAVRGPFSRAALGSSRKVVDILANIAMQRERAIIRGEKMRVAKALYGLVASNPNPEFWVAFDPEAVKDPAKAALELQSMGLNPNDVQNFVDRIVKKRIDPKANAVVTADDQLLLNSKYSMPIRINGKEKYVIFNSKDPRAARMAEALKNLDAEELGQVLSNVQTFTQYFAKINTQYNPVFGVVNFVRDVGGAILQLSTTAIRGKQRAVLAGVPAALRGIYAQERARRKNKPPVQNSYAQLWEEFQKEGAATGFRDQFSRSQDRAAALERMLDPSSWANSTLGKVFTAGGTLKVPMEIARKGAAPFFEWLEDYNQTMENAVRLSAYKVALDNGLTKQQAASVAKNLTVNFNRKGQIGRQAGALYAFFNASVQGTSKMIETLRGPAGQRIIFGGLILGSLQALTLSAAGFDDDEPPEFIKSKNIILPIGDSKYITIPMPLGYNVIPNTSRIVTEWMMSGFKNTPKRVVDLTGAFLDMFNPIGNAGWSIQTIAPTIADPIVALSENKDWTGKPIAKEDMSSLDPTPGYTRAKENASIVGKEMSRFLNAASGGTNYTPGVVSPTPDQIDYLIGQLTGGVGRELLKAEQSITSQFTGEELPMYKVPLVGRFLGETTGMAAERNRFYSNVIELNKHERELEGRRKDRVPTQDYLMEYPEARLYSYANQVERNIQKLKKRRDMLIEKDAPKEQVKAVENQMMVQMKRFNDRVRETQQ